MASSTTSTVDSGGTPGKRLNGIIASLLSHSSTGDRQLKPPGADSGKGDTDEAMDITSGSDTSGAAAAAAAVSTASPIADADSHGDEHDMQLTCVECGRALGADQPAAAHMRRHIGYRPYSCSMCAYAGYDEADVSAHTSSKHVGSAASVRFNAHGSSEAAVSDMLRRSRHHADASVKQEHSTTTEGAGEVDVEGEADADAEPEQRQLPVARDDCQETEKKAPVVSAAPAITKPLSRPNMTPTTSYPQNARNTFDVAAAQAASLFAQQAAAFFPATSMGFDPRTLAAAASNFQLSALQQQQLLQAISASSKLGASQLLHQHRAAAAPGTPCGFCGTPVDTADTNAVLRHVKAHVAGPRYECVPCGRAAHPPNVFTMWHQLAEHLALRHAASADQWRLVETAYSVRSGYTKVVLDYIEQAFNGRPTISCSVCAEKVPLTQRALDAHVSGHMRTGALRCSLCARSELFADAAAIRRHHTRFHADSFMKINFQAQINTEQSVCIEFERIFPPLSVDALESLPADGRGTSSTSHMPPVAGLAALAAAAAAAMQPAQVGRHLPSASSAQHKVAAVNVTASTTGSQQATALSKQPLLTINNEDPSKATVTCQVCGAQISRNMSCLIAHAKVHLGYKPLQCEYCSFRHFAMSKIRRHNARVHVGQAVKVSYHPISDIGSQVKDMKRRCFGPLASSTVWDKYEQDMFNGANANANANANEADSGDDEEETRANGAVSSAIVPSDDSSDSGGSEDGYNKCTLCGSNVRANLLAYESHVYKHLQYKPYQCADCGFGGHTRGRVQRHAAASHPDSAESARVNYTPRPDMAERIEQAKMKCFPFLASIANKANAVDQKLTGPMNVHVENLKCSLCEKEVLAIEPSMDEHITTCHIPEKNYHCPVCTYQTTFLIRAKQHVHSAHPTSQETRILCCPADGLEGLKRLREECFGADVWRALGSRLLGTDAAALAVAGLGTDDMSGSNGTGTPTGDRVQLTCAVCNALIDYNYPSVLSHARTHMVDYRPYQCTLCTFSAGSEADVKAHMLNNHSKSTDATVKYNPENKQLTSMIERCFPSASTAMLQSQSWRAAAETSYYNSNTMLKKLTCQVCKNTIADNPKSIGIHVKNHLNYKPYRCPHCKYMSCEQSKARRHVEHVHSVSGDSVEIHAIENIKERIVEMKARCFPTLAGTHNDFDANDDDAATPNVFGDTPQPTDLSIGGRQSAASVRASSGMQFDNMGYCCGLCNERVPVTAIDTHVRGHLGKPFKCDYCSVRFGAEERVRDHIGTAHAGCEVKFSAPSLEETLASAGRVRQRCFPDYVARQLQAAAGADTLANLASVASMTAPMQGLDLEEDDDEAGEEDDMADDELSLLNTSKGASNANNQPVPAARSGTASRPMSALATNGGVAEGRLTCRLCDQPVSVNPNSLDVHAKTHLNFKQHQCGYCPYRSCMSAKVKRHLDNVHRGQEIKQTSLSTLPSNIRAIVNEMRSHCFPNFDSPGVEIQGDKNALVINLRRRLLASLHSAADDASLDNEQRVAAKNAALGIEAVGIDAAAPIRRLTSTVTNGGAATPIDDDAVMQEAIAGLDERDEELSSSDQEGGGPAAARTKTVQCQICRKFVSRAPAVLAMHVRRHAGYIPYRCGLCSYTAAGRGAIRRHVRAAHKCTAAAGMNQFSYTPDKSIKQKIIDMKSLCFPTGNSALRQRSVTPASIARDSPLPLMPLNSSTPVKAGTTLDSLLNLKLAAGLLNGGSGAASQRPASAMDLLAPAAATPEGHVRCNECNVAVMDDDASRAAHCRANHWTRWRCSDCEFSALYESDVRSHADEQHAAAAVPIRFEGADADEGQQQQTADADANAEMLSEIVKRCFEARQNGELDEGPDDDEDLEIDESFGADTTPSGSPPPYKPKRRCGGDKSGVEGPRYQCQLCHQNVSMYASSLYVHVKNHLNYKPYHCPYCDYKSPVKSKVRRHVQNAHRKQPFKIDYRPLPGVEHQILQMKRRCFPTVGAGSPTALAAANGTGGQSAGPGEKVTCALCKQDVAATQMSKVVHAKNHMDAKPFHCGHCSYRSCLKAETRRHVQRAHASQPVQVRYNENEAAEPEKLADTLAQCFSGATAGGPAAAADLSAAAAELPPSMAPPPAMSR